jgi:hypothetical protein
MLPDPPADDIPVSPELAEEHGVVRELEARMATEHGADTPDYWRAVSGELDEYVAGERFAPIEGETRSPAEARARAYVVRVAAGYRALAASHRVSS